MNGVLTGGTGADFIGVFAAKRGSGGGTRRLPIITANKSRPFFAPKEKGRDNLIFTYQGKGGAGHKFKCWVYWFYQILLKFLHRTETGQEEYLLQMKVRVVGGPQLLYTLGTSSQKSCQ